MFRVLDEYMGWVGEAARLEPKMAGLEGWRIGFWRLLGYRR